MPRKDRLAYNQYNASYMRQRRATDMAESPLIPSDEVKDYFSVEDRKRFLSHAIQKATKKYVNPVVFVQELNKMEGVYPPERHLIAENRQLHVTFKVDADPRVLAYLEKMGLVPPQLIEGETQVPATTLDEGGENVDRTRRP